jgi:hypothetical protein
VFPNNAAKQERYYITNVLKKPQPVSIRQFVQHVEQLNSYISQLLVLQPKRQGQHDSHERVLCRG